MTGKLKGIPDGASVVIPRLVCRDPAAAIEFCASTFSAVERVRRPGPDGTVAHALMTIGPAMIMIEAEWPTLPSRAPARDGSSPVVIYVYVEDVDQTVARAIAGGAQVLLPVQNQFWGDRTASIMDPSGHVWTIATRIEETSEEERKDRWSSILADQEAPDQLAWSESEMMKSPWPHWRRDERPVNPDLAKAAPGRAAAGPASAKVADAPMTLWRGRASAGRPALRGSS